MGVSPRPEKNTRKAADLSAYTRLERWLDEPANGEYALTLGTRPDGGCDIIDPQDGSQVIESFDNRQDALHWLNEDEYVRESDIVQR